MEEKKTSLDEKIQEADRKKSKTNYATTVDGFECASVEREEMPKTDLLHRLEHIDETCDEIMKFLKGKWQ